MLASKAHLTEQECRLYMMGHLRGLFDADGSFSASKWWRPGMAQIILTNTERSLLRRAQLYLSSLNIHSKLLGPYQHTSNKNIKPIYRLRIWRKDSVTRFFDIVGTFHPGKQPIGSQSSFWADR